MPITSFSELIDGLKGGSITFGDMAATVKYAVDMLLNDGGVGSLRETLASIMPFMTYILLALAFVEAFRGQKLIGIQKIIFFGAAGYALGALVVPGLIDGFIKVPALAMGIALAVVAAVLHRTLYNVMFFGFIGYSVYMVLYSSVYFASPTEGARGASLAVGAVVAVIAFAFRPAVERLGTAAFGAWGVLTCLLKIYDFTALLPSYAKIIKIIVFGIVFFFGFLAQHRRRKRY